MNTPGSDPANPLPAEPREIATGEHLPDLETAPGAPAESAEISSGAEFGPIPPPTSVINSHASWGEDFRTSWGWLDLILLLVVAIGSTILSSTVGSWAFFARGVTRVQLENPGAQQSLWILVTQIGVFACLMGFLWFSVALAYRRPFWQTAGWRPLETGKMPKAVVYSGYVLAGGLLCFLVSAISDAYSPQQKLPIQEMFQDRRSALLFVALAVLLAPLIEETIFRGYIYPVVARTFGMGLSVLVTGTLFGLLHAKQLWGGWVQIAMLVMVGIFFTYARAMSRTVVASYLLHLGYNSFMALGFMLSPLGYRALPLGH